MWRVDRAAKPQDHARACACFLGLSSRAETKRNVRKLKRSFHQWFFLAQKLAGHVHRHLVTPFWQLAVELLTRDRGIAFVAQLRLAKLWGVSRRRVPELGEALAALGLVAKVRTRGGRLDASRGRANGWQLTAFGRSVLEDARQWPNGMAGTGAAAAVRAAENAVAQVCNESAPNPLGSAVMEGLPYPVSDVSTSAEGTRSDTAGGGASADDFPAAPAAPPSDDAPASETGAVEAEAPRAARSLVERIVANAKAILPRFPGKDGLNKGQRARLLETIPGLHRDRREAMDVVEWERWIATTLASCREALGSWWLPMEQLHAITADVAQLAVAGKAAHPARLAVHRMMEWNEGQARRNRANAKPMPWDKYKGPMPAAMSESDAEWLRGVSETTARAWLAARAKGLP